METMIIKDNRPSAVIAKTAIDAIVGGEINPLQAWGELTRMEEAIATIKGDGAVVECALREVGKYGRGGAEFAGFVMKAAEVGVRYDYSECGDDVLADLEAQKKEIDEAIKERQKVLRSLPPTGLADTESGVIYYPPIKTSKTTIKATKQREYHGK